MHTGEKKHLSFGSFLMIFISILVIAGFAFVFPKLTGGNSIDVSKLAFNEVLDIHTNVPANVPANVPTSSQKQQPFEQKKTYCQQPKIY